MNSKQSLYKVSMVYKNHIMKCVIQKKPTKTNLEIEMIVKLSLYMYKNSQILIPSHKIPKGLWFIFP